MTAVDIRVRYPEQERGIRAMDTLRLGTEQGMVPLSNFVQLTPAQGVDTFERINGIPVERVRANVVEGVLADTMVKRIDHWLSTQEFDPGLESSFSRRQ